MSQAFQEGLIEGDVIAIDATHIEARDRKPEKKKDEEVPVKQSPKKRGRKPKAEREKWLKEQQELEENRPLFEKKIEAQLPLDFKTITQQIPQVPHWFGFKGHLLVDCKSQYILSSLLSVDRLNKSKRVTAKIFSKTVITKS